MPPELLVWLVKAAIVLLLGATLHGAWCGWKDRDDGILNGAIASAIRMALSLVLACLAGAGLAFLVLA